MEMNNDLLCLNLSSEVLMLPILRGSVAWYVVSYPRSGDERHLGPVRTARPKVIPTRLCLLYYIAVDRDMGRS